MADTIQHIAEGITAKTIIHKQADIAYILTDSRRLLYPMQSLYFALKTTQNDGHLYIPELVERGVYNFVVNQDFNTEAFQNVNFIIVENVLDALQATARNHRAKFTYPVIGITGSNGKTIVKEWLFEILNSQFTIVRSPRSYNSQIGVPLSVWGMGTHHDLAIFEAGISQKGEMQKLAAVIQPTIAIITSIGTAHQEGFSSLEEKLNEKLQLAKTATILLGPYALLKNVQPISGQQMLTWGATALATLYIKSSNSSGNHTELKAVYENSTIELIVPFTDNSSIENVCSCWLAAICLGMSQQKISQGVSGLMHLDMRMQIKKGINNCYILNDSYSNDIIALQLGLEYAKQQAGLLPITLIISDFAQGQNELFNYEALLQQLMTWPIKKLITIGPALQKSLLNNKLLNTSAISISSYVDTDTFIKQIDTSSFKDEFIMLKGARVFELEKVNAIFQAHVHQTVVEVNLTALVNNYKKIKTKVGPEVQVMAMVKAFGYGSGSVEVARALQFHHVNYLAVAYADEGVELRKAGIYTPIMVMNVDEAAFDTLVQFHLEPEIFSFEQLEHFTLFIQKQGIPNFPIHIKLNTGMNRLGFDMGEMDTLAAQLKSNTTLKIQSIFSHLSASGQAAFKDFTLDQLNNFTRAAAQIEKAIGYTVIKHIANSDAILMDQQYHLDMVRLGIGMYGVSAGALNFETVVKLKTTIAQIRNLESNQTVGYNRAGVLDKPTTVATVRLGYADGYARKLGRGKGSMWVGGQLAPIVGDICMDMTMIDITGIVNVHVGDTVEVFGPHLTIDQVSKWAETIPYEILTTIGQRVKRIYIQD